MGRVSRALVPISLFLIGLSFASAHQAVDTSVMSAWWFGMSLLSGVLAMMALVVCLILFVTDDDN